MSTVYIHKYLHIPTQVYILNTQLEYRISNRIIYGGGEGKKVVNLLIFLGPQI